MRSKTRSDKLDLAQRALRFQDSLGLMSFPTKRKTARGREGDWMKSNPSWTGARLQRWVLSLDSGFIELPIQQITSGLFVYQSSSFCRTTEMRICG